MKKALLVFLLLVLTGCIPYPARIVMPLKTQVVDAESGAPIEGAQVLRIMGDIHDKRCTKAIMDRGQSDKNGIIKMAGDQKWRLCFPAPGGMPVPNHRIAIWKSGYKAFVFSQYGNIGDIKALADREDLKKAVQEVPLERIESGVDDKTVEMFSCGKIKLSRLVR